MSVIAGLQDFRQAGPPADIGTFLMPTGVLVFHYNFSGTIYYAGVRAGERGWVLADFGQVPDVVINSALTDALALGLGEVTLAGYQYPLQNSVTFPGDELVLRGMGRATFLNGDALTTGNHAIVINGYADCVVRDLSVQTEDGGGKICYCVYVEGATHRFTLDNVTCVDSDSSAIFVSGTAAIDIEDGTISFCKILGADDYGIWTEYTIDLNVTGNTVTAAGYDGIYLTLTESPRAENNTCYANGFSGFHLAATDNGIILGNTFRLNVRHGIHLSVVDSNIISHNKCLGNDSGNTATYDGIYVSYGTNNNITDNNVNENHRYGITLINVSLYNIVADNEVNNNDRHGIYVNGSTSNIFSDNTVFNNGWDAAGTYNGIHLLATSNDNIINDNYCLCPEPNGVTRYQEDGIHLATTVYSCLLNGNTCNWNLGSGIALANDNDENTIVGNRCEENDDYGIEIANANAESNFVKENHLIGNSAGQILDNGTETMLPEIWVPVWDDTHAQTAIGNIGDYISILMNADQDVTVRFNFKIPDDLQELVRARLVVVATAANPTLRWGVTTDWAACDEAYNANGGTIATHDENLTQNNKSCLNLNAALAGIYWAAGDAGVTFTRNGAHANDDAGDTHILGFWLQYV